MLETAPTSLFGGTTIKVDGDELSGYIMQAINLLPTEVEQAYRLVTERDRILSNAYKEAEHIKNDAEVQMKKLISQHQISLDAKIQAEEVLCSARKDARDMQMMAVMHADDKLKKVEYRLKNTLNYVHEEVREFEKLVSESMATVQEERNQIKEIVDKNNV